MPSRKGERGERGIPGPAGRPGKQGAIGETGVKGAKGATGRRGAQGLTGATGPSARTVDGKTRGGLLSDIDRHIDNIYAELGVQMKRTAQIQVELDDLRAKVRRLMGA